MRSLKVSVILSGVKEKILKISENMFMTKEGQGFGTFSVDQILVLTLGVLLFTSVIPTIADNVAGAVGGNVTGASATLLSLVVLVIVIVFIARLSQGTGTRGRQ